MKNEVILGNGVGAGPYVWSPNPLEFTHLDLSSDWYHHKWLFNHHYGQHKNAILPMSYLKQIESMTVHKWLNDMGDGLVVFPSRYNGIDEKRLNLFKDEHCIVWLGYDRKIIRQMGKIAKELCTERYPDDDTTEFLRMLKHRYFKKYGDKPWEKTTD